MSDPAALVVHVQRGPLELPIARHRISAVAIGRGFVRLDLRSTDDLRGPTFELSLFGAFSVNGTAMEQPSAVAEYLDPLIDAGIVAATATADDGLDLELMSGRVLAERDRWSLEGSDGRRWQGQPGGGIAHWTPNGSALADAPPMEPIEDDDGESDRTETAVEVGRGIDLPGAGLHLVGFEVSLDGAISLTAHPRGAQTPATAIEAYDGPELMEAMQFFATLDVGPGTVPPDPEVLEAMKIAVERSDFGLGGHVWITLDSTERPGPEAAIAVLGAIGSELTSVRVWPGGRLEVVLAGGVRLSSDTWRLQTSDHERWTGSRGEVIHMRWRRAYPRLSPANVGALAAAWLDYDRTGKKTRFWAWSRVEDVIRRQPITGWSLVRRLIAGAADPGQLSSVAAGPLEDLLGAHGPVLIDRVEAAAREDPRVMQALAGVWKDMIDDEDWIRIQRLLGREPL